jgi:hypothetical protein
LGDSRLNVPDALRVWHMAGWRHAFRAPPPVAGPAFGGDPGRWPEPWRSFFHKVPSGARLFITYPELGKDLAGQGDTARSAFWRLFLSYFQAPLGTFAFWPCALYEKRELQPSIPQFCETLSFFSPPVVACFGKTAHDMITAKTAIVPARHGLEATQFMACPDVQEMMRLPEDALREIVHMLLKALTRP